MQILWFEHKRMRAALFQWARTQMVILVRLDYNLIFFCCLRVAIKAEYEDNYKKLFISPLLVFYDTYLSGNVKYKKVAGY